MVARIFEIQSRQRQRASIVSPADFNSVENGTLETRGILENPQISLYCLDDRQQQAIFVATSSDIRSLSQEPFFYQAQFETAQRLITLDYNEFHQLAQSITQPIANPIFLYSVGRCGSTLLSKIFAQVENCISISEPDIFSQIVHLREPDGCRDEEILKLIESCTRILCKPNIDLSNVAQSSVRWTLKFRGLGIGIADLIVRAFPHSQGIFLYRHAEDTVASFARTFGILPPEIFAAIEQNLEYYSRSVPTLKSYFPIEHNRTNAINLYTVRWLWFMERYIQLYHQGILMQAMRYEDLRDRPSSVISAMFEYFGLPLSELDNAGQVLNADSQAGSMLAKEGREQEEITPEDRMEIRHFLKRHPKIKYPDFQVPGTLLS